MSIPGDVPPSEEKARVDTLSLADQIDVVSSGLGNVGVGEAVTSQAREEGEAPPVTVLCHADFDMPRKHGLQPLKNSFSHLLRLVRQNPDIPLEICESNSAETCITGDPAAALDWIKANRRPPQKLPHYVQVLERLAARPEDNGPSLGIEDFVPLWGSGASATFANMCQKLRDNPWPGLEVVEGMNSRTTRIRGDLHEVDAWIDTLYTPGTRPSFGIIVRRLVEQSIRKKQV